MTQFAEFQQKAKRLATNLARAYAQHMGCLGFFSALMPSNVVMDDAATISMLASKLDETYDLIHYVKIVRRDPNLRLDDFNEFRSNVLIGVYLVKWFQHNSIIDSYIHNALIDLFRSHLGVQTLEEINQSFFNSCLDDFSYYCTFVYSKHSEKTYADLNNRLGATIQKEIHETRNMSLKNNSSWYGFYKGIMNSFGMSLY